MRFCEEHGVFLNEAAFPAIDDEHDDDALDAAENFLIAQGHSRRRVQRALLLDARAEMKWWSERVGARAHDCSRHHPSEASEACDPDARLVPMVLGLPAGLTRPKPGHGGQGGSPRPTTGRS